jgi:hypothetical protein
MVTVMEPIAAGLIVAVINKWLINNNSVWEFLCSTTTREDVIHEDASSSTTSINDFTEAHVHFVH